jgi:hypothetical protein
MMMRGMFGPKKEEMRRGWRKLHEKGAAYRED